MKKIFLTVLLLMTFVLSGCGGQDKEEAKDEPQTESKEETQAEAAPAGNVKGDLKISMLNVGQGDAILIQTGKQTILIDTSDTDERELLVKELEKLSVTKIDKLILTHPHADHIGNAKVLINPSKKELNANPYLEKISVAEVYDNGIASTSPLYKSYMKAVGAKGIVHKSLKAGDALDFGNSVKFNILYPTSELVNAVNEGGWKSDPNNESVVGKLTYKKFSMMFTGDAEKQVEAALLSNNKTKALKCDVLKAGHHGSYTASTKEFIAAVNPSVVLISCGPDEERRNTYGHPHLEPLENYLAQGINEKNIFCTRWNKTITITSDGKNFSVQPEDNEDWVDKWITKKQKEKKK
ncbi:MAG: MBL fold metallo-hydrolase [Selenomonadaceae bacterium]|nr:MBL fold metallo-hydrolase [Selenomonadaceae bacterium]